MDRKDGKDEFGVMHGFGATYEFMSVGGNTMGSGVTCVRLRFRHGLKKKKFPPSDATEACFHILKQYCGMFASE